MLGQDNNCTFQTTESFTSIFGDINSFEGETALKFTLFDPAPDNIILRDGDINKPCIIDYEWFFNFPVPVSFLKFRIAQHLSSSIYNINNIIQLHEILEYLSCSLSTQEGMALISKFEDFVYREGNYSCLNINQNYMKKTVMLLDFLDHLRGEMENTLNSRSWRITKPLRKIADFLRRNKI
jgi:hypothetical protein